MQVRALKTPPIKEAIIAVSFRETLPLVKLQAFCESQFIKDGYPTKTNLMSFNVNMPANEQKKVEPITSHKHDGYVLNSGPGGNKSIQLKIGQLSFHNTKDYLGWENFYNEFLKIWKTFCETAGKMDLTQLSVRYINEVSIPLPLKTGFVEYTKLLPMLPEGMSPGVNSFFMQVNLPSPDNTLTGIITETFTFASPVELKLILDINVIKAQNFICSSAEMWDTLAKLRNFKNHLFFNCLTEKAIQRYE